MAVIGLFGTVVAVGTPAYLGFQTRRADKQAHADLVAAVWPAEAYKRARGTYVAMDTVDLLKLDPRTPMTVSVAKARRNSYCLATNVHGRAWSVSGPSKRDVEFKANGTCA